MWMFLPPHRLLYVNGWPHSIFTALSSPPIKWIRLLWREAPAAAVQVRFMDDYSYSEFGGRGQGMFRAEVILPTRLSHV